MRVGGRKKERDVIKDDAFGEVNPVTFEYSQRLKIQVWCLLYALSLHDAQMFHPSCAESLSL